MERLEQLLMQVLVELRAIAKGQEEIRALLIHRKKGALRQEKYAAKSQDDAPKAPPPQPTPASPAPINGTSREHSHARQDDVIARPAPPAGPAPPLPRQDDAPPTSKRQDDARGEGGDLFSASSPGEEQETANTSPPSPSRQDDATQVFAFWMQQMGKRGDVVFKGKRQRNVEARLRDGYTVERLCQAIRGCKLSPHHQGENETGTVYDDLELICRNPSKVDFFIGIAERPPRSAVARSGAAQIAISPEARREHDVPGKKWLTRGP